MNMPYVRLDHNADTRKRILYRQLDDHQLDVHVKGNAPLAVNGGLIKTE